MAEQFDEVDALKAAAAAAAATHRAFPQHTGGPHASYPAQFLADALAKHAPGDEDDPVLRRIWRADGNFYALATPATVLRLLARLEHAEDTVKDLRAGRDDHQSTPTRTH